MIKDLRLAENICSKEYISKIENGHKCPSDKILSEIFLKLGEPLLNLLEKKLI